MHKLLTVFVLAFSIQILAQPSGSRYELVKLKEVNTPFDEGSPIISPDGKTLYFFVGGHPENTYGKVGTQDIWMSKKDDKGVWSAPKHLTSPFNQNKLNQVFNVLNDGSILVRGTRSKNSVGFSIVSSTGSWRELNIRDFEKMNKGQFWGASVSADLKHMILYFSETAGNLISDLYVTHAQPDGSWMKPMKMALSTNMDDFGPFISPDQKTLYFATNSPRTGRQGLIDIYKCERLDDTWNKWGPPVNLGKPLNTSAEDDYFSMDAAGNIFVARSNSKQDGGNLDIFVLVPKDIHITLNGIVYNNKTKQVLVGSAVDVTLKDVKPFNLKSDAAGKFSTHLPEIREYSLSATAPGFMPFTSSFSIPKITKDTIVNVEVFLNPESRTLTINGIVYNNKTKQPLVGSAVDVAIKGFNPYNLNSDAEGKFSTMLPETRSYSINANAPGFLPFTSAYSIPKFKKDTIINVNIFLNPAQKVLVINGTVTNKKNGNPVDAKVIITKRGDNGVNFNSPTSSGTYSQTVPSTGLYYFTASHEGFLNTTDSLNYNSDEVTPMTKDLALQPIEVGAVVRLKNIYFDYNKASLKKESFVELEKVVTFLNENPTVEIEIEGHTDSDGADDRNLSLSQNRSQSVVDYISSKGIAKSRLKAKGFGESKPIDTNDTDAGRANNRRVEFTVLKT